MQLVCAESKDRTAVADAGRVEEYIEFKERIRGEVVAMRDRKEC